VLVAALEKVRADLLTMNPQYSAGLVAEIDTALTLTMKESKS
jgi:hypothetical protein